MNRLLADDSHEISYVIFFPKIRKDDENFVVCCSCDWRLRVNQILMKRVMVFTFLLFFFFSDSAPSSSSVTSPSSLSMVTGSFLP